MEQAKTGLPKWKTLLKLLWSTLYISAFTFGGGFVIVTFMKRKFVDELHWIDVQEMLDLAALAQSSPGATMLISPSGCRRASPRSLRMLSAPSAITSSRSAPWCISAS